MIDAYAILKRAAAVANHAAGRLDEARLKHDWFSSRPFTGGASTRPGAPGCGRRPRRKTPSKSRAG
jgi:hypothetical protein